jgi:hypothetical protein
MLKKAGIVVLGATAGVMSLSGMAFAGEAHSDDSSSKHHEHHDGDKGHDRDRGGSCDKTAVSSGDRLLSLDNVASNLDISRLNVLGKDDSINFGGECKGDKTAVSQGDRLISADNLLANADVSRLNVLGKDGSVNA